MEQYNDEIQLKDILIKISDYKEFLLKKKFTIIGFSLFFSVIGILYSFNAEIEYNAQLTFVVEPEQAGSSLAGMSGIANQFGFDIGGGESSVFSQDNVLELLKSRGVIVSALRQHSKINSKNDLLIEHYLEINKIREGWDENNKLQGVSFHEKWNYIHDSISGVIWLDIMSNNLIVELPSNEANIITLSYTSLDEEFAKEFAEQLIHSMSKMYISHKTAQANNTLDFLHSRADSVFSELEVAEQELARVTDINQRIVKASGRLKELQLMRKVEVLNAMYLEIVKNLELSKITLLNKTPIINIIDNPILPLERKYISKKISALLGFFLGGFLSLCYFIFRKLFKDALTVTEA
jgi:uncharacterized protein involved in exopolysaccharide biosynthesis